jgi:hypothetical protein
LETINLVEARKYFSDFINKKLKVKIDPKYIDLIGGESSDE